MKIDTQNAVRNSRESILQKAATTQGENGKLNKSDFLNLFVTQLSNQDPLDPMDSAKMMTQVSQLGNMEQLQAINAKLDTLNSSQELLSHFYPLEYLGKNVAFEGNHVDLKNGNATTVKYTVPEDLKKIDVKIMDSQGEEVAKIQLGQMQAGLHQFKWDGKDKQGNSITDGEFSVNFRAVNKEGKIVPIDTSSLHQVSQVSLKTTNPC